MSGLDDIAKRFGISSLSDFNSQVSDGFFGNDTLRDYTHASKLMRPNGLALAPKQKFLFHVYFNTADPQKFLKSPDTGLVGALVKTVQLPTFRLDTKEYVQYNRKRLVHNRINYEPITIKLHDDGEGHVLDLWQKYYQYYFADSTYDYESGIPTTPGANGKGNYNQRDIYERDIPGKAAGWGKTITSADRNGLKPAFFKDIQIYGFNRGGFVLYTLINPVITSWQHDTYDYSDGAGTMEHTVTLQYETVKYSDSVTTGVHGSLVNGFGDEWRYDQKPGALGAGSTTSLLGQGGLGNTVSAIGTDLANNDLMGAIRKAGQSVNTFGSFSNLLDVVKADSVTATQSSVLSAISTNKTRPTNFPKPGSEEKPRTTTAPRKA